MPRNDIPVIPPYNPLDKKNLAESVASAMLSTPVQKLPPEPFIGAGVYAIYYRGSLPLYQKLAELNRDSWHVPIYVGKAVPAGARKGGQGVNVEHGQALAKRLSEHFISIHKAVNLDENDFVCRFLVVDDIWIPLAESMMIEHFKPVWNTCIDGFGNHTPGNGRFQQQRSPWDCIHPGREWAEKCSPNKITPEEWRARVADYLSTYQAP